VDPPCPCPAGFAGRCPAKDSARRASGTKESNSIKIRASEGLHSEGVARQKSVRQQAIITHGACGRARDSEHGTLDPGHCTTQFICSHSGHKTEPNSRFPNICSLCVLVFPFVSVLCALVQWQRNLKNGN